MPRVMLTREQRELGWTEESLAQALIDLDPGKPVGGLVVVETERDFNRKPPVVHENSQPGSKHYSPHRWGRRA